MRYLGLLVAVALVAGCGNTTQKEYLDPTGILLKVQIKPPQDEWLGRRYEWEGELINTSPDTIIEIGKLYLVPLSNDGKRISLIDSSFQFVGSREVLVNATLTESALHLQWILRRDRDKLSAYAGNDSIAYMAWKLANGRNRDYIVEPYLEPSDKINVRGHATILDKYEPFLSGWGLQLGVFNTEDWGRGRVINMTYSVGKHSHSHGE